MNTTHLYIGDNLIDLKPSEVPSITLKGISIASLPTRQASRTNRFVALPTESNLRNLGYPNSENSRSSVPYSISNARTVSNGIETMSDANCFIESVDSNGITLSVYENIYDYFADVLSRPLSDIDLFANSGWEAADIDAARTNTDGIVTAVMNWGWGAFGTAGNPIYDVDYFLPCFYYHTVIKKILEYTGLTLFGNILTDARFTDLVIPYWGNSFTYADDIIESVKAQGVSQTQNIGSPSIAVGIQLFLTRVYGNISSNAYVHSSGDYQSAEFFAIVGINITLWGSATLTFARIIMLRGGIETTLATSGNITSPTTTGSFVFSTGNVLLEDGDQVYVKFFSDSSSSPTVAYTIDSGSTLTVVPTNEVNRGNVNWNILLSTNKVTCKDLLNDFFTRFAIMPFQRGNTLYLKTLEEILADKSSAMDWSANKVRHEPEIDFNDSDYAQENLFSYLKPDDVATATTGQGSISLSDNTIRKQSKQSFTSVFYSSRTYEVAGGWTTGYIPVYTPDSTGIADFNAEPKLRIMTLRDPVDESNVQFDATPRADYRIAYFVDSAREKDTGWQYFIDQFYPSLSSSLQRYKGVKKKYYLTEKEINQFDRQKLMYDGDGYYIVVTVPNFVPGKVSVPALFKIW